MTDKVIEILNSDPKARMLLGKFKEKAAEENITGKAYESALETITMLAIVNNKEALSIMAEETYNLINA